MRYMTREDFRVLVAVEMGMRNHEVVPTELIVRIAALRNSNSLNIIGQLAKYKLIQHVNHQYDGYKLTYQGYDFLALKAFISKGLIKGVGRRIGVGKESDVYEVLSNEDEVMILKIHRLGRICFRNVREKRDYLQHRKSASFLYMSRLAAVREFAYLKALYDEGFPTPIPYEINRHCILMSKVHSYPLCEISVLQNPERVYNTLMNILVQFAEAGLIHGDFNEFNLLIDAKENITVIDFPQMISVNHPNAKELFDRDAACIRRFFNRKLGYEFHDVPEFIIDTPKTGNLDVALHASGAQKMNFSKSDKDDYERIMRGRAELEAMELEEDEDEEDGDDDDDDDAFVLYDDDDAEGYEGYDDEDQEEDQEEDEEEEGNKFAAMRSRRAKNMQKYNTGVSSNAVRSKPAYNGVDLGDIPSCAVALTSSQLEGVTLDDQDEDDEGDLCNRLAGFELDDDEDDEDEDDEDAKKDANGPIRRRKKKSGLAQSQLRQKLQNERRKKQIKNKFKSNTSKVRDRKMKAAIKEIRSCM